jgi:hypothetical protein
VYFSQVGVIWRTFFPENVFGHTDAVLIFKELISALKQGCQMVSFQTKNSNLGKFWRALDGKCLYILRPFGIFCVHLVHFSGFGKMCQEKSGNLALKKKAGFRIDLRQSSFVSFVMSESVIELLQQQGCQIFLGTPYQNGNKYNKWPQNLTNGRKIYIPKQKYIYQMATKYIKWPQNITNGRKICIPKQK